jgi:hypothetical protein
MNVHVFPRFPFNIRAQVECQIYVNDVLVQGLNNTIDVKIISQYHMPRVHTTQRKFKVEFHKIKYFIN